MIVSIGIMARNEESAIQKTLLSFFEQSVFFYKGEDVKVSMWEVIVVANGCTDKTSLIAEEFLRKCCEKNDFDKKITWKVVDILEPGKSNSWNLFIHNFSNKKTELFILLDADIVFNHVDTVFNCIKELNENHHASVVVDLPLKHFSYKKRKNLVEWISTKQSNQAFENEPAIAGSFYCARAEILRNIWMPPGLSGEDGFLRAMVVTDFFRAPPDPSKVVRASNASHFFEGLTKINDIFRHELRMVIGTSLNCYFCWDFLVFATDPSGLGAGHLIKTHLINDPDWYKKYIANEIRNRRWWVLPKNMLFRRFLILNKKEPVAFLLNFVLAMIALILDIPVLVAANRKLKKGAVGYW